MLLPAVKRLRAYVIHTAKAVVRYRTSTVNFRLGMCPQGSQLLADDVRSCVSLKSPWMCPQGRPEAPYRQKSTLQWC
jgi:hypothetical protein